MLSAKDRLGAGLIIGVAIALIGVLAAKANLDGKPAAGPDNCVGEVSSNTVIVLDYTESIAGQTRDEIEARAMAHIRDKVGVNERVSIFTISDLSQKSLKPLITLCKPPDSGNRAIENVQLVRKRFQQTFEKPIREVLADSPGNAHESAIAQALTDISLSQYLRGSTNTLLIFSDMLEHTAKFSLYRCTSAASIIELYRESRRGAMERPEFKSTDLRLHLIPRLDQTKETLKCRDRFWAWFFSNNSGKGAGLSVDYLPGGASMGMASPGAGK